MLDGPSAVCVVLGRCVCGFLLEATGMEAVPGVALPRTVVYWRFVRSSDVRRKG